LRRRIHIVRHGNTFDTGDVVTRVGARTDLALSQSGRAQAGALAAHFRGQGVVFTEAVSSPLRRTRETAETILAAQSAPPALRFADFLREIDYGPDENKPEEQVIARIGVDALQDWETAAVVPPGWQVDPDGIIAAWRAFFAAVSDNDDAGAVLMVTSNGIARFALIAAGLESGTGDLKLKTGAYGVLGVSPDRTVSLDAWNVRPAG